MPGKLPHVSCERDRDFFGSAIFLELKTVQQTAPKNVAVTALITITNCEQYQGNGTEDGTEDLSGECQENVRIFSGAYRGISMV